VEGGASRPEPANPQLPEVEPPVVQAELYGPVKEAPWSWPLASRPTEYTPTLRALASLD